MELHHSFTVPTDVAATWEHFQDIESVAECFPGAQVTAAEGDTFTGSAKVKLGPIALVYNGTGTFVEKDEAAHRMVIDAKGKDKRGNGTAGAMVTMTMTEAEGGTTEISVDTDLQITGKAAQFGRGNVIKDVSDKLLGQFVDCLGHRLAVEPGAADADAAEVTAAEVEPTPADATEVPSETPGAPPTPVAARPAPTPPPARPQPKADDAINLGTTVLPVLARTYGKYVAGAIIVIAVIWWLIARN
jgi:carbon monoxide dehydrogenase subunit G